MRKKLRVIHYLNQFFAQIGGEEKADIPPFIKEGPVGPGVILEAKLRDRGEVVATVICGDNYFSSDVDKAVGELLLLIKSENPEILIAGPAFNAGRYGIACGEVCRKTSKELGIPCITGMCGENPGVEMYRKSVYIIETPGSAIGMKNSLSRMVEFAINLFERKPIGPPEEEGYFQRGIRKNVFSAKLASERVLDMLMAKLSGSPFVTEVFNPTGTEIEPVSPLEETSNAKIALVTEGGLVPKGNPDRIKGARCTRFGRYPIWAKGSMPAEQFECVHRGFDPSNIDEDPNRLVPIDALIDMEEHGEIGKLFPFFYSTCGCGMYIGEGRRIGREIAKSLKRNGVQGVILVAT